MMQEKQQGKFQSFSASAKDSEKEKELKLLEYKYGGVTELKGLPDVMIVVDAVKEKIAVNEAEIAGIPVIALLDSNADPHWIDFPVAGNASGTRSIDLFVSKLEEAIITGQAMRASNPVEEPVEKTFDAWMF